MTPPRARIKSGKASLVGGVVVGFACFALWLAVTHELGIDQTPWIVIGLLIAVGIGAWIRIADL